MLLQKTAVQPDGITVEDIANADKHDVINIFDVAQQELLPIARQMNFLPQTFQLPTPTQQSYFAQKHPNLVIAMQLGMFIKALEVCFCVFDAGC